MSLSVLEKPVIKEMEVPASRYLLSKSCRLINGVFINQSIEVCLFSYINKRECIEEEGGEHKISLTSKNCMVVIRQI